MITRSTTSNFTITPEELALEFADMDSQAQAEFFNHLALAVAEWPMSFRLQLQAITDEDALSSNARYIMHQIGEYSSKPENAKCFGSLLEENRKLRSMCKAAAAEIESHWDEHCDADGYGPINLVSRLSGKTKPDLYPAFDS